jgi:leucyl-tRNA synthetase
MLCFRTREQCTATGISKAHSMQDKYSPQEIEAAAQTHWNATQAYRAVEHAKDATGQSKPKFYVCSMLPYPSGKLHMGHVRNYTLNDVMYRILRMRGYNVMTPMGWDAFGLPAENAAIDKKVAPSEWTRANIADMKSQMQPLGLAFDWSREVATCDPSYYKWNQWLFLKMLERGIAYRKTQIVNWDPVDQTVLANEQVVDGRGWRSGAVVEKREIPGYYLGITQYAEQLLDDLKTVDWPPQVVAMQENWIGKSVGVNFGFPYSLDGQDKLLRVFTTRADTIMGVTFVAIAAEHPLATRLAQGKPELTAFIDECKKGGVAEVDIATMEKKGMPTGFSVTHPLTGEAVPVWIGNYVLMGYGEGAVMGVPGHDERDFAFAKRYGLLIKQVIDVRGQAYSLDAWQEWYADKADATCIHSGRYDNLGYTAAVDAIAADLKSKGLGDKQINYRLRDWGISRQRYWGTPIPLIHCESCGVVPVPEQDLPVLLPEGLVPDGSGSPLAKYEPFLKCTCPTCGKPARRETDTMDTFVDSAWYYMRYCSPDASTMVDARTDYWMTGGMDQYIGGIEHAVLHLLYARFWTKVMRDLGLVKFSEPFKRLFTQGMLTHDCYYRELPGSDGRDGKKRWFYPSEIDIEFDERGRPLKVTSKEDGQPVFFGGTEKMSKSKNNVVEPRDIIGKFGADTARTFAMFAGPPDQSAAWSNSGAEGTYRFLRRLWNFSYERRALIGVDAALDGVASTPALKALRREIHLNLKQADFDYARMQYNTVVSAAMKMLNALDDAKLGNSAAETAVLKESLGILLRTLYPIAPHITHALWNALGFVRQHGEILDAPWPQADEAALITDEIELVVQVNGKLRGQIRVPAKADKAAVEAAALADANVQKFIAGQAVKKLVVVPGKLVNVVV